ncbi:MAG: BrnT family toxin [Caulobacteraceae bacterium]|nr:BrnT family toxin [Caulobacteraceae bacterium]
MRRKVVGTIQGQLITVVYTPRSGVVRIIPARRSNAMEKRR